MSSMSKAFKKLGKGLKGLAKFTPVLGDLLQGIDAKKMEKKAAKRDARLIKQEAAEERRRATRAEAERAGAASARMGASGLRPVGSQALFEEQQQEEFARQMGWLDEAASSRAKITKYKGKMAGERALWGGISSASSKVGSLGNWW